MEEHRYWEPDAPVHFPPPPTANECTIELAGLVLVGLCSTGQVGVRFTFFFVYVAIEMKMKMNVAPSVTFSRLKKYVAIAIAMIIKNFHFNCNIAIETNMVCYSCNEPIINYIQTCVTIEISPT